MLKALILTSAAIALISTPASAHKRKYRHYHNDDRVAAAVAGVIVSQAIGGRYGRGYYGYRAYGHYPYGYSPYAYPGYGYGAYAYPTYGYYYSPYAYHGYRYSRGYNYYPLAYGKRHKHYGKRYKNYGKRYKDYRRWRDDDDD